MIPLNVSHKTVITRMFQSAGATLTSLDATVYVGNADPIADMFDLKTIRDWCPLSTSLFVKLTNASSETVLQRSHLILSYRGQLKDFNWLELSGQGTLADDQGQWTCRGPAYIAIRGGTLRRY